VLAGCGGESVIGGANDPGSGGTQSGSGGAGGTTGGSTGLSGSSGTGATTGEPFPIESLNGGDCDYPAVLARNCALSGCHKPGAIKPQADLILMGDSGLVSRVKDVPATHADIYCGSMPCPTIPAACPPAQLVDSSDWQQSWIYRKITDPMECGDRMPPSITFTPADRACVVSLIQKIAALP
jgi:hypothetical protein